MTEIDIDALLAGAGTVREESADNLLWRLGRNEETRLEETGGAFEPWHRYRKWRKGVGHRAICPECNRAFTRDRPNARRCKNCRGTYQRKCLDCGEGFTASHYALKWCPPCRAKRLKH